jgi:putative transposase
MKKSRYTDSQILNILKQAENGVPVPELCREHGPCHQLAVDLQQ